MRNTLFILCLFFIFGGIACRPASLPTGASVAPPTPAPTTQSEAWPSKDEVLAYLDGKPISLAESSDSPEKDKKRHTIKKDQIEVLQVTTAGSHSGGEPWSTEINFVINTGEARYAVVGRVEHKLIESKRAFFGFQVQKVARQ